MADRNPLWDEIDAALVAVDAAKPYTYAPQTKLPALSPQMQAALDAEAAMVANVLKRAREMVDELIAARAELRRMSEWHDQIADTVPCDVAGPHYGIVEWHRMVLAERDAARAEVERLRASNHNAYSERDRLVQALSTLFPSYLCRHPAEDLSWEDDWRWIVTINLPTGQACWHIHDSERDWFSHLCVEKNQWDGHTTEQKYERLQKLLHHIADSGKMVRERHRETP